MKKLKQLIEPFILRRIKKEVLTELPNKRITVLYNKMGEEQEKLYKSYLSIGKSQIKILSFINEIKTNMLLSIIIFRRI